MAAKEIKSTEKLRDLIECTICSETFTDPRVLMCNHTFCLACLQATTSRQSTKPGDEFPCPLCRKEFKIPSDGVATIQKNFTIQSLIDMSETSNQFDGGQLCGVCLENCEDKSANIPQATMYCVECKEHMCDRCTGEHRRQKFSRNHRIVPPETLANQKTRNKCDVCATDCEDGAEIPDSTMYCIECEENLCDHCYNHHKRQKISRNHQLVPSRTLPFKETASRSELTCDVCMADSNESSELISATMYCIECEESLCDNCCSIHKRQKFSRDHSIVPSKGQSAKKGESISNYCNLHRKEELRMYCLDCKTLTCMVCLPDIHSAHQCFDAKVFVEEFRRKTQGFFQELEGFAVQVLEKKDQLKKDKDDFMTELQNTDSEIRKDGSETSLEEIDAHKHELLKQFGIANEELERHHLILETFRKSTNELISTGSMSDICRAMNRLNLQMEELQQQHTSIMRQHLASELSYKELAQCWEETTTIIKGNETNVKSSEKRKSAFGELNVDDRVVALLQTDGYMKVRSILPEPVGLCQEIDLRAFWSLTLPYITQRLKMWNGTVISAQKIASLVSATRDRKHPSLSEQHFLKSNEDPKETIDAASSADQTQGTFPVSRLDCIAYIVNAADCFIAQDILRMMAKFPMTLPFIIPDLKKENEFIVTLPLIKDIVVKWESTPGHITENHLFTSPYKMVVAVRLGSNHTGKSSILNQLMAKQYMFSSKAEPGGKFGQPLTLNGTVEIVWLTKETCSDITWNAVVRNYYKNSKDEVAILANLHGNALEHEHILKYLEQFASSFLVFQMPDSTQEQWGKFRSFTSNKKIFHIQVDPNQNENSESEIHTNSLLDDETQCRLRNKLQDALNVDQSTKEITIRSFKFLHYHGDFKTEKSEKLVQYVKKHGCSAVKQAVEKISTDKQLNFGKETMLGNVITMFLDIFNSVEITHWEKSLIYLETTLSRLSSVQSKEAREQVIKARDQLSRIVNVSRGDSMEIKQQDMMKDAQEKLKESLGKVDSMNLGQEHFFRAVGEIYKRNEQITGGFFSKNYISNLPSSYAKLLISGHEIELLNGDLCEIPLIWIKAICNRVCELLPQLKIFVISIIGLQSSGKSTLLNALFACRFAVSVGRCSRGLFMRMLHLDEDLREKHGYDAIILIDTEGLSSPEKMNDPKASQKDRQMATYAMGVSNLTIVNILNEGMTEMTEILQIAIVAMARLREGGIKPDMILVQHLQERNLQKTDQAKSQFCEAINKAFELICKKDVEIGAACSECLDDLVKRIQSGDLFHQFGFFKDGSTVNSPPSESYHEDVVQLFETILKRLTNLKNKLTFQRWSQHFESYWACVKEENFALNFKNVEHITNFLYFEKKVSTVKVNLNRAFRSHKDILSQSIRQKVNSEITRKHEKRTDTLREDVVKDMRQQLERIPYSCNKKCQRCEEFVNSEKHLLQEMSGTEWEEDTKRLFPKLRTELLESTLKVLEQTFNGSVVRQGCFSEFSDVIEKELKDLLQKRPQGAFSPEEQDQYVQNIWELLRVIAESKDADTNLDAKIDKALIQEYVNTGLLRNICSEFKSEIDINNLNASKPAKRQIWGRAVLLTDHSLDEKQLQLLQERICNLVSKVLTDRKADCFHKGINFEEGMISDIKDQFPAEISQYEKTFNLKLSDKFKLNLQVYTLQQLRNTVRPLQQLWNHENQPSEILMQKEKDYKMEIQTRLKNGFSSAGEGEIVAMKVIAAIKQKSLEAGLSTKVQSILDIPWTTSSETVRLKYFEQLAKEVNAGTKDRALKHFKNPKGMIECWYRDIIGSLATNEKALERYKSVFDSQVKRAIMDIQQSLNKDGVMMVVKQHIQTLDDQYYSKLDIMDEDFKSFNLSLQHKLETSDRSNYEDIVFPSASNDPEITSRLGCTENCFWCGALCWGSVGHQVTNNNASDLQKHHSCHQPGGLRGVSYRQSKELVSDACHNTQNDCIVHFGEHIDGPGMKWKYAKRDHFNDWLFNPHCVTKFDEMMRWFFQKLHRDIAQNNGLVAAKPDNLKKHGCSGLNLNEILETVHSKM